jgi:CreA protein
MGSGHGQHLRAAPETRMDMRGVIAAGALLTGSTTVALAEEVGSFTNDWIGNGIVVEAIADPKVDGVTCHMSHFDRSIIDRLSKGNWFEDPSNAAISCQQTGPITIGDIEKGSGGEEVFSQRISLVFKSLGVRRIYDEKNQTLIYVVYSRQITQGSAKMGISSVALAGQQVSWRQ